MVIISDGVQKTIGYLHLPLAALFGYAAVINAPTGQQDKCSQCVTGFLPEKAWRRPDNDPTDKARFPHLSILPGSHSGQLSETLIGHQEKTSPAFAMKCFIEQNVHRSLHIDEIVSHVHLSRSRGNDVFKREYRTTPYHYYLSLRLKISMNLLRHSPMTVQEISNHLDFPDYHHFTAFFKKWCGLSPSQYRRESHMQQDKECRQENHIPIDN